MPLLLVLLLLSCHFLCSTSFSTTRPNFIFLLADDQDIELGSINFMPNLNNLIISEGISFDNAYVATPICCSSRTETLTGRYYQNIGAPNGTCMHVNAESNVFDNMNSLFQLFYSNDYLTSTFGKLTNDMTNYFCEYDTPRINGFSRIEAPCHYSNFYGTWYFHKYDNGTYYYTNNTLSRQMYEISQINNSTLDWIKSISNENNPFIIWYGTHTPHFPAVPAYWYGTKFSNLSAPRTPNFNVLTPDKHGIFGNLPKLEEGAIEFIDQMYRTRLSSMLLVDDFIADLVELLGNYSILNNTYIIYSSDHGYHLGQWRIGCTKRHMYETDIKIPLYIRGPNIGKNTFTTNLVGNVDILPTLLELANISVNASNFDGKSFVNSLEIKKYSNDLSNYFDRKNVKNSKKINNLEIVKDNIFSKSNNITWRQYFMSQFRSQGDGTIHNCLTWYPIPSTYPGTLINPMKADRNGSLYYIGDYHNNWRTIRIINDTYDWSYGEFIYYSWNDTALNNPWYYELYDIKIDPYQMNNIYNNQTNEMKQILHSMVMELGVCCGNNCP